MRALTETERQTLLLSLRGGDVTRATLARDTGRTAVTISKTVAGLLAEGMLEVVGTEEGGLGRKAERMRVNPRYAFALGADIGFARVKAGVVGFDGSLIESASVPTGDDPIRSGAPEAWLRGALSGYLSKYGREKCLGASASISALVDAASGSVRFCPNIAGFTDRPYASELSQLLGVPVRLNASVRALALSETAFGETPRDTLYISLGSGSIAAAVSSGGRVLTGADGFAGEIGHIPVENDGEDQTCSCGGVNCLELFATYYMASRETGPEAFARACRAGEENALRALGKVARRVGQVTAAAVNLVNPAEIVFAGAFLHFVPQILPLLDTEIRMRCLKIEREKLVVRAASTDEFAPILGGARGIIQTIIDGGTCS